MANACQTLWRAVDTAGGPLRQRTDQVLIPLEDIMQHSVSPHACAKPLSTDRSFVVENENATVDLSADSGAPGELGFIALVKSPL